MSEQEIERKFDLDGREVEDANRSYRIRQAYLGHPSEHMEVRVRQKIHIRSADMPEAVQPTEHTLTVKAGAPPTRMEKTQEIGRDMFYSVFSQSDLIVEKTRHEFPLQKPFDEGDLVLEVDCFEHPIEMTMAEIEFESEEQAQAFDPAEHGLGHVMEVTGDPEYTNKRIAQK